MGLYWGYIRVILGSIRVLLGNIRVILGLYWDNAKQNGNYYIVFAKNQGWPWGGPSGVWWGLASAAIPPSNPVFSGPYLYGLLDPKIPY